MPWRLEPGMWRVARRSAAEKTAQTRHVGQGLVANGWARRLRWSQPCVREIGQRWRARFLGGAEWSEEKTAVILTVALMCRVLLVLLTLGTLHWLSPF